MEGIALSKQEAYEFRVVNDFLLGKMSRIEASELLNVSTRTMSRKARKIETQGLSGIKHGNCANTPYNKTDEALKLKIMQLVEKLYFDFNVTHMHEMLDKSHNYTIGYQTLLKWCHEKKLVKKGHKRKNKKPRKPRQRKTKSGMMLQMDGSHHFFVPFQQWVLIAGIDDATNEVPYGEFFSAETTYGYFEVLKKTIHIKEGIPYSIYVDRAGCLGGSKRVEFGQFVRACEEMDTHVFYANSPQAKGRIERFWQVVQDRCVAEFRKNNIKTIEEANKYFNSVFLEKYWNNKKLQKPHSTSTAYRELKSNLSLEEIFCFKYERKINYDHTIKWKHNTYQLHTRYNLAKQIAEIREYHDNSFKVFFADKEIKYKLFERTLPKAS